ncbi:BolA family transcriptional regulator [Idiomarina sp. X4]|jgi:acid stress-induced BolA-like protein IbaG/YrbA|uniref:Cell division protein BolA n=1 Tax=Idiomarina piscisalsi TaxID=1096243 RepID=A0ABM6LVA3_9GAMM|nr:MULTISPECIES: BolA family protein [Idiomarina]ASG66564.1 cell division protein BolA [Idiomarina piscisalsi]ATZ72843.1 BolA family transcriptional regulator [Idiomarina sp. X4]RXS43152.1 BolA family transcriptional regulator [Idiomarina sp. 29L]
MNEEQLKTLLNDALDLSELYVKVDGANVEIIAVSEAFESMNKVKRQQAIYAPLNPHIASGEIHAVSIKAYTPDDWARDKKLMMP